MQSLQTHTDIPTQPEVLDYIQEAAQDFFIPRCPSVLYLASKQAILYYYRLTMSSVKLFLTGIPRDTCKGPLVNL